MDLVVPDRDIGRRLRLEISTRGVLRIRPFENAVVEAHQGDHTAHPVLALPEHVPDHLHVMGVGEVDQTPVHGVRGLVRRHEAGSWVFHQVAQEAQALVMLPLHTAVVAERRRTGLTRKRQEAAVLDRHVTSHIAGEAPVLVPAGQPALVAGADLDRFSNVGGLLSSLLPEEVAIADQDVICTHHVKHVGCARLAVLEDDRLESAVLCIVEPESAQVVSRADVADESTTDPVQVPDAGAVVERFTPSGVDHEHPALILLRPHETGTAGTNRHVVRVQDHAGAGSL